MAVQPVDRNSAPLTRRVMPTDCSECHVILTLLSGPASSIPSEVLFDKETRMIIGHAVDAFVDQVEITLESMIANELCQITFEPNHDSASKTFSENAQSEDIVIVGVKLLSFERQPDIWELTPAVKLSRGQGFKERGVELFKRCRYEMAFKKFSRALKYSILVGKEPPADILEECNTLKCQCYLNLAACQLQKQNYSSVIDNCSKALCLDQKNVKGLYRRAQALCKLDDYTSAVEDLKKAQQLEPSNKAVTRLLASAEVMVKKQEEKMASAMSKMFV